MTEPILEEPLPEHAPSPFIDPGYSFTPYDTLLTSLLSLFFTRLSHHLIHFSNIGIESDALAEPIPDERSFVPVPPSPIGSVLLLYHLSIIS
jgi:hypothetical protein